jgi:hypothetical protein
MRLAFLELDAGRGRDDKQAQPSEHQERQMLFAKYQSQVYDL